MRKIPFLWTLFYGFGEIDLEISRHFVYLMGNLLEGEGNCHNCHFREELWLHFEKNSFFEDNRSEVIA